MSPVATNAFTAVDISGDALRALLPQRPPLLLVERILGLGNGKQPALRASYRVGAEEPVLAGHFPGRPLWPGAYTIEGLAQACALLGGLLGASTSGRMSLPLPTAWAEVIPNGSHGLPLLAAVNVKLLQPVAPPAELIYDVVLTHVVGAIYRFDAEAACGRNVVARGTLSVACVEPPP